MKLINIKPKAFIKIFAVAAIFISLIIYSQSLLAQGPPPPPGGGGTGTNNGGNQTGGSAPIGGGTLLLVGLATLYGSKKIYRLKSAEKLEE